MISATKALTFLKGKVRLRTRLRKLISHKKEKAVLFQSSEEKDFIKKVECCLDRESYLSRYPDVHGAGMDPLEHWLNYGYLEGRVLRTGIVTILRDFNYNDAQIKNDREIFKWRNQYIEIGASRLNNSLLEQILDQSRHDAAVLSAGVNALPALREYDATDIRARDKVDAKKLYSSLTRRPFMIIVMPFLGIGGAEKYVSDVVMELNKNIRRDILVIVTDQNRSKTEGWKDYSILKPLQDVQILYWRDLCSSELGHYVLAKYIHSLRPEFLLINNSRVGLDAVAHYGKPLSQQTTIYCTYFSYGLNGLGVPYGVRFPQRIIQFSHVLTDNQAMGDKLEELWGGVSNYKCKILPPYVEISNIDIFEERATRRFRKCVGQITAKKWLWVSRIEYFKGTNILAELARLRDYDEFHLFGPIQEPLESLGLQQSNIIYKGVLPNVLAADFSDYDGFVFTSLFEGMPNIVLEISQHALPLILADVGGLSNTFDKASAVFVEHSKDHIETAIKFNAALDFVRNSFPEDLRKMVYAAYQNVLNVHGAAAFKKNILDIFQGNNLND